MTFSTTLIPECKNKAPKKASKQSGRNDLSLALVAPLDTDTKPISSAIEPIEDPETILPFTLDSTPSSSSGKFSCNSLVIQNCKQESPRNSNLSECLICSWEGIGDL